MSDNAGVTPGPDDPAPPTADEIRHAADVLRAGGVVAFPTETVYGLGADAASEDAVRRVFELKGRPRNNPMIVHVADVAMARTVVGEWPDRASDLAGRFWPGPLTLVLRKAPDLPDLVTAGHATVGVRCPDHPLALALIRALGRPIAAPSANPSGRVSPTTARHVRDGFPGAGLTILDGGPCRAGIESTVLSLVHDPPRILRPGAVPREDLGEDVQTAGPGFESPTGATAVEAMLSPGRMPAHYAPVAPVRLFGTSQWPAILDDAPPGTVVITHEPAHVSRADVRFIRLPESPHAYAASLYAALREADALAPARILIERPEPTDGLWAAIHDRLRRAAAATE